MNDQSALPWCAGEQAADATELLIELGLEPAQNRVHAW